MSHKVGLHWIRTHPGGRDYAHIERMQYPSAKLFEWHWSDRNACREFLAVLPGDSYILARDHPLSEQKQDMWNDPAGTGTRHANEWASKVQSGNVHTPVERTFFLGVNEPDATSGDRNAIDLYTSTFLDRLRVHGLRGGAFNFSTGHPRTVDGTGRTPADYSVFERSHQAIVRGHHIAVLHIYGTAAQPLVPGHYDRLKACPWQDVEWIVGECAIDEHVIGGGHHDGYLISMAGRIQDYCAWLDAFIMGIGDPRIHSYQVFTYDYSHPWSSFDVREIRDALEVYDWQHAKAATKPPGETVHLPSVPGSGTPTPKTPTAIVNVRDGANLRSGPSLNADVLGAVIHATPLSVVGKNPTGEWYQVQTAEWGVAWVSATVVHLYNVTNVPVTNTETTPPVPPVGDTWTRSRAFTRRWEGGFQDFDWDDGNWTGCEQGKGIKKGTNFGISACSYPDLDIRNITIEQADAIYFRDYWQKSGADKLSWPMCLLVFDTAVNFHPTTAKKWLAESGGNPLHFVALRLRGYRKSKRWKEAGNAWVDRVIEISLEASQ